MVCGILKIYFKLLTISIKLKTIIPHVFIEGYAIIKIIQVKKFIVHLFYSRIN